MIFKSPYPAVEIPDLTLSEYLFAEADEWAGEPAIIDAATGAELSYADLRRRAAATAVGFVQRGLEPGDRVALLSPNLPDYAVAFHGVAMAGGCTTTLNPLQTADELESQVSDSGARWIIAAAPLLERAREVAGRVGAEEVFIFEAPEAPEAAGGGAAGEGAAGGGAAGGGAAVTSFDELARTGLRVRAMAAAAGGHDPFERLGERIGAPADTLVTLPYSSGTTGRPKGVMLTHRNLVANIQQCLAVDPIARGERVIAVLPFFHIYGMVVVMSACLRAGATIITMPRFDLDEFLAAVSGHRVGRAYLVPPIILALARHPAVERYDLTALEYICSGAAPLGEETARACARRIGCEVFQGYGLTETSPVTHMNGRRDASRIGTVGPPVPNTEMCIVDLETGERLGPGREGEVWVRGPQVMAGYLGRREDTARTIDEEGWLHTGDVGRADEEGYLTIVDRAKELIKYKGYQVPPAELEEVLLGHPSVRDAAVIPSPDEEAGEVPKAFVVAAEPVTAEEIMEWVAERVAPYKKLRRVEFIETIPKSPSGKILRRVLVARERSAGAD